MALLPGHSCDSCGRLPWGSRLFPSQMTHWVVTRLALGQSEPQTTAAVTAPPRSCDAACVRGAVFLECLLLSEQTWACYVDSFLVYFMVRVSFSRQVHICTTGLIVTPPPSSPVTTATVFTFPSESSYSSIPVVGRVQQTQVQSLKIINFINIQPH